MATGDLVIRDSATTAAPKSTEVSGAADMVLLAVNADIDGSGAAGAFLPTLEIVAPGGVVTARVPADEVAAGSSAEVTWAPFLESLQEPELFPRNLGELGASGTSTLGSTHSHTIQFQDVEVGDGILVLAMAPTVSAPATTQKTPFDCNDAPFNVYDFLEHFDFQAFPPNVNEGVYGQFFFCQSSTAPLRAGVDTIDVTWTGNVYDRYVEAWIVRHEGGANYPTKIAATADNDAAVFASAQVTLTSPAFTPARDNALAFAAIISAKAGGVGGFGGVGGYAGYLELQARGFTGSKQTYAVHQQTYGANALEINPFGAPKYEVDLGQLPGGTLVGAFNGVGQFYTAGANAWKGIVLFAID